MLYLLPLRWRDVVSDVCFLLWVYWCRFDVIFVIHICLIDSSSRCNIECYYKFEFLTLLLWVMFVSLWFVFVLFFILCFLRGASIAGGQWYSFAWV